MDRKRLVSGIVIVSLVLTAITFLPKNSLLILVGLITGVSCWEFLRFRFSHLLSATLTILFFLIIYFLGLEIFLPLIILFFFFSLVLGFFTLTFPHNKNLLQNSIFSLFSGGVVHLTFFYSIYFLLSSSEISDKMEFNERLILLLIISISALMDTVAYFSGRRFGVNKFLPNISPNKTFEGFVIALVITPVFLSALVYLSFESSFIRLFLLIFITSLYSVLGDAVASLFKRLAGVKDSSSLIPGHGGMFDRIDSHLFAFPIFIILFWILYL